jgi:glutamate-ammonia-ligase adenylyltransferase
LESDWNAHRERVTRHFARAVFGPTKANREHSSTLDTLLEREALDPGQTQALAAMGFESPERVIEFVRQLREGYARRLDETGRRRLKELLPRLLDCIGRAPHPDITLSRIARILERIGGRTVYLALLNESDTALKRLVDLCARSGFLAEQIAAHPLLLDELIGERGIDDVPTRAAMERELKERRDAVHGEDAEAQVEMLRKFQRAAVFRIAVADLTERLPLMKVSDRLTDLAELIVREGLELAWENIVARHGAPLCGPAEDDLHQANMTVVAYGKFGGIELGYGSDLDLVLLHDSSGAVQRTAGPQVVDSSVFFQRVGQRFIHFLTVHSAAGRLYEVDSRLRPGGNRGLLVQSVTGFEDYQRNEAWTWEHQALLRTRAVAGPSAMCERFETLRIELLRKAVRRETLREEVRKMRGRMRTELTKAKPGEFDLKQDAGGIADLEFLVQYWTLLWADRYPEIVIFSDNIRQLESLASGALVPQARVDFLTATYRLYRTRLHHLALDGGKHVIRDDEFVEERAQLVEIWNEAMEQ